MNSRHVYQWCMVNTLLALIFSFGSNKAFSDELVAADAVKGVEVLTRGPVHEAFAETVTYDPEPGVVATKAPPAAIEEVPPEQRLEGNNVAWIPGYWAWDDERNDFLWVSGIWRAMPVGRQWVPGYWGKSEQGFQWTSGYWANSKVGEVEYLPEPPATVEAGPNIAAPSPDDTWLPGCWVWQNNRYVWRPGFWAPVQQNWVWVPAHYVWASRGYIFVDGYWDYAIGRRGVLFAPVYFDADVYGRQGFSYSPTTVIDLGVFANYLFLRPRYQHYYFGDYYDTRYDNEGFYPSYAYNSGRFGYDPIFAHERWQHRQDRGWEQGVAENYLNRREHEELRPPRTWAGHGLHTASDATARVGLPGVAALLDNMGRNRDSQLRFQPVNPDERKQFIERSQEVRRLRDERQKLETNPVRVPPEAQPKEFTPARVKQPGSPITARPAAELGKENALPKTYDAPDADLKVEPKPRPVRSVKQPQQHTVNRMPVEQPQSKAEPRVAPQPQPKAERQAPQAQPKAERQAPQAQPKAERQAQQPKGKDSAGPKQEKQQEQHQEKDKGKDKN